MLFHFLRVPFICKFKPGIPGFPSVPDYDEDDDDYETHDDDEQSEEMYSLKVEVASEHGDQKATLLESRTDSATVRSSHRGTHS